MREIAWDPIPLTPRHSTKTLIELIDPLIAELRASNKTHTHVILSITS